MGASKLVRQRHLLDLVCATTPVWGLPILHDSLHRLTTKKRVVSFSVHTYTAHKSVPFKRGREHDGGERIAQPTLCYIQSPMQHRKECII
jgi:hypothetical protein